MQGGDLDRACRPLRPWLILAAALGLWPFALRAAPAGAEPSLGAPTAQIAAADDDDDAPTSGASAPPANAPSTAPGNASGTAPPAITPPEEPQFRPGDRLTGDWGGVRRELWDKGVSLTVDYIGEALGNVSGGIRKGAIYEDLFTAAVELDLERLLGWQGALFHASAFQIDGRGLSANDLHNIFTPSEIEARRTSRLDTLWLQQSLLDDRLSIRAGELAADDEFVISETASNFVNSCFGWPPFMGANLPSGGAAYPLATTAARVEAHAMEALTFRGALFAGDPAGQPSATDSQLRDLNGTAFSTSGGAFTILEAQYTINQEKHAAGLPGSYKLGAWYHSGSFADERFDASGGSLAAPGSSGIPFQHHGDYGFYAIIDQMVWRKPSGDDEGGDDESVNVFFRLGGEPLTDRNLLPFYMDTGVALMGPFPGRGDDMVGLAFAYGAISGAAQSLDRDMRAFTPGYPIRDYEAVLEVTYRAQLTPWWTLQPDLQLILHPGGNIPDPLTPASSKPVRNALVLGLRTTLKF
jgi:porin